MWWAAAPLSNLFRGPARPQSADRGISAGFAPFSAGDRALFEHDELARGVAAGPGPEEEPELRELALVPQLRVVGLGGAPDLVTTSPLRSTAAPRSSSSCARVAASSTAETRSVIMIGAHQGPRLPQASRKPSCSVRNVNRRAFGFVNARP